MSAPTPGRGWTEITDPDFVPAAGSELLHWAGGPAGPYRQWVLTPSAPLPTLAPTIIRVTAGPAAGTWTLDTMGWRKDGSTDTIPATQLQPDVDTFETIAEPRAVTATAVLTDVRAAAPAIDLDPIAATYGATLPQTDA